MPQITKKQIIMLWRKNSTWLKGIDYALSMEQIIERLGFPSQNTSRWERLRNKAQSLMSHVRKSFRDFREKELYFGGIYIKRGESIRYLIADTPEEYKAIHDRRLKLAKGKIEDFKQDVPLLEFKLKTLSLDDVDGREIIKGMIGNTSVLVPDALTLIEDKEVKEEITDLVDSLPFRESQIVKLRLGLETGYKYTLGEIASIFGITRERVRQIEKKAVEKMRRQGKDIGEFTDY